MMTNATVKSFGPPLISPWAPRICDPYHTASRLAYLLNAHRKINILPHPPSNRIIGTCVALRCISAMVKQCRCVDNPTHTSSAGLKSCCRPRQPAMHQNRDPRTARRVYASASSQTNAQLGLSLKPIHTDAPRNAPCPASEHTAPCSSRGPPVHLHDRMARGSRLLPCAWHTGVALAPYVIAFVLASTDSRPGFTRKCSTPAFGAQEKNGLHTCPFSTAPLLMQASGGPFFCAQH